jgi:UDP-glucose 4-epimerase
VTGGAGFVGSHLVERLIGDGWEVLVVDDLSTGRLEHLPGAARLERLDIAADEIGPVVVAWGPAVVYHLAAQASVPVSQRAPLRDLAVNVTGTHRVATAAQAAGAGRLVFASSGGAIYGETTRAATERTSPAPTSYYGVHKLAAEGHVALAGLSYAIARPSNIYGPRQTAGLEGAVVATFVGQALAGQPLTIDGDGRQTRDLIHVHDVVAALVRLGDPDGPSGIWNVASGRAISVTALAASVERSAGVTLGRVHRPVRPGDVRHATESAALLRRLGWTPSISLARGIRELLDEGRARPPR